MVEQAFRFQEAVGKEGKVELTLPLPLGTKVEVVVLAPVDESWDDLWKAAGSSMGFWNNPEDDEAWNNV